MNENPDPAVLASKGSRGSAHHGKEVARNYPANCSGGSWIDTSAADAKAERDRGIRLRISTTRRKALSVDGGIFPS